MKLEDKKNYKIRLDDALDFLDTAKEAFEKNKFKVCLMNAGDAAIAANDAFTIYFIEQKASLDHREAFKLHTQAGQKINENNINLLKSLIEHRHAEGYRCTTVSKNLAKEMINNAIKFISWVQDKIK